MDRLSSFQRFWGSLLCLLMALQSSLLRIDKAMTFKRWHSSTNWLEVDDIIAAFDNEEDSLNFLKFLNNKHRNIKFNIEKQINYSIAFLDVFISGINNQNLTLQTYHKSTYTGLLLDFKSFVSFSYKISLINCLKERSFKICNNLKSFHNDIEIIKSNLIKSAYPPFLIDEVHIKNKLSKLCKEFCKENLTLS